MMEQNSPAEELPALYRAILDRVAELEAGGDRAEAARVRADRDADLLARLGRPRAARARGPAPRRHRRRRRAGRAGPRRGVRTGSVAAS